MQDIEGPPGETNGRRLGIAAGPVADIDIASNGSDRRNPAQSFDDMLGTDISGVNDMRGPAEALFRFRPQQTVCV